MKLHLGVDGKVFEYERRPMRSSRFRAICGLFSAGIYAGMVATVASICGMPGVIAVAVVTTLFGLGRLLAAAF